MTASTGRPSSPRHAARPARAQLRRQGRHLVPPPRWSTSVCLSRRTKAKEQVGDADPTPWTLPPTIADYFRPYRAHQTMWAGYGPGEQAPNDVPW